LKVVNRDFQVYELKKPLELASSDGKHHVVEKIKIHRPLAGNLKNINFNDLSGKELLDLAADCGDQSIEVLDCLQFEDMSGLIKVVTGFLSSGDHSETS